MTLAAAERDAQILSLVPTCEQAARVAKRRHGFPQDHDDLVSYAMVGAIHAVDRFDGVTGDLDGYAWARIFGAVMDGVRRETGGRPKLRPTVISIDSRRSYWSASVDSGWDWTGNDVLPASIDEGYSQVFADDLMARLPDMIRRVHACRDVERDLELFLRYIEGDSTLAELGAKWDITESRASQIVSQIRSRLRRLMDEQDAA